jgi:hypothetical protein
LPEPNSPGPIGLPFRWTRLSSLAGKHRNWPILQRIGAAHRARERRRQLIMTLVAAVVLVLLGLVSGYIWLSSKNTRVTPGESVDETASIPSLEPEKSPAAKHASHDDQEADEDPSDVGEDRSDSDSGSWDDVGMAALRSMIRPSLVTVYRGSSRGTGFVIEGGLVVIRKGDRRFH